AISAIALAYTAPRSSPARRGRPPMFSPAFSTTTPASTPRCTPLIRTDLPSPCGVCAIFLASTSCRVSRIWRINDSQIPDLLAGLFAGNADVVAIIEQWDQLVRIAASLKARTAPAHVVLQRLTSSGPSDRVAKALTALGRLVKTRNILRYLHDEPLRLRIQTQLNRGEARHSLARWLFFAEQGEFRTSDFEMIMNKASCLSLLSNAVVLWNTLQIERIVTELRASGTPIRDEDLIHVWPLQRRHITPNGVYFANRTMPAFVLPDPVEA